LLNESGIPAILHVAGCDPVGSFPHLESHGFLSKATQAGRAKLCALLASSDFLLLPTRAEAAGLVFCEASAWGLPIISTDTGGVGTYVRNGINGVTLPLNVGGEEYARAIAGIIADRQLYEQLSRSARNEYETRLNWDTALKSALDLLTHDI
jgi:glycosyltransferase involved in cell wall biosynthesis